MSRSDYSDDWNEVCNLVSQISEVYYDGSIYDTRCQKYWDSGQLLCAALYGPDWFNNEDFERFNNMDSKEPIPERDMHYIRLVANKLIRKEYDWCILKPYENQ